MPPTLPEIASRLAQLIGRGGEGMGVMAVGRRLLRLPGRAGLGRAELEHNSLPASVQFEACLLAK